ncbi:hypothetical protein M0813_02477 [Anaeramoeba flamelloides]|uniref:Uncharacterized protein n=1 Tax=Anaeramoeba flamelloides TaxID=1746091 RepID=A0ABQ8YDF5_9EUKA|nr:hypothetical protein M0813_02477 [Anaeramoeba flamelloides]
MIKSEQMTKLTKKFGKLRSMNDRLFLFLQFFPNSIKGLKLEDLQMPKQQNMSCSELLNASNIQNQNNSPNSKQNPKKIVIIRSSLTTMSGLTGVSRRSLERGLSNFFERNYSLHNISPYSRDYMIFGETGKLVTKKISVGTKKHETKKKKTPLVGKEKRLILKKKAKKTKKKTKTQINPNRTSNITLQKQLPNKQNNIPDNNWLNYKNDKINLNTKNKIRQKNVCQQINEKFSPITRKRNHTYTGKYYSDQDEKYISFKSPLHLLSVISQTHKRQRSNLLFQNMSLTSKNNQIYQPNHRLNSKIF